MTFETCSAVVAEFDIEAEERLAIEQEAELAIQQTIPQITMIAGLIRAAHWPR